MNTQSFAVTSLLVASVALFSGQPRQVLSQPYDVPLESPEVRCSPHPEFRDRGCYAYNPCPVGDAGGFYWSVDPERSLDRAASFMRAGDMDRGETYLSIAMWGYAVQGDFDTFWALEDEYIDLFCPERGTRTSLGQLRLILANT